MLCIWLFYVVKTETDDQYKVIDTNNGQVRGARGTTLLKNLTFYSFKGIPYAKPAIDDLRFKVKCKKNNKFLRKVINFD